MDGGIWRYNVCFLLTLQDIARLLQLQEEKKHKKHYPEPQGHTVYEDSYYAEDGGMFLREREKHSNRGEPGNLAPSFQRLPLSSAALHRFPGPGFPGPGFPGPGFPGSGFDYSRIRKCQKQTNKTPPKPDRQLNKTIKNPKQKPHQTQ